MSLADTSQPVMLLAASGNDLFVSNCCAIALGALLFHDYFLTIDDEVRSIWKRKSTGATFLFLANRYLGLLYRVVTMLLLVPWYSRAGSSANQVCTGIFRLSEVLGLILEVVYAGISSFRVYAIWGLDRRVLLATLALGLVLPCLEIVYYMRLSLVALHPPYEGCGIEFDTGMSDMKFALGVCIRTLAILLHALVLVLTWVRTLNPQTFWEHWKFRTSLSLLLLRDGALYFVVLVALNIIDLIDLIKTGGLMNPASTIVITSVLMSRFILNLRTVNMQDEQVWSDATLPPETCLARSMVGNLGALMDMGDDESRHRLQQESKGNAFGVDTVEEVSVEAEIRRLQRLRYHNLDRHDLKV